MCAGKERKQIRRGFVVRNGERYDNGVRIDNAAKRICYVINTSVSACAAYNKVFVLAEVKSFNSIIDNSLNALHFK